MSKLNRILWSGLVLVGAACGDDVTVTPPPPPPEAGIRSVTVAPDGANVAVAGTLQMTAAVTLDPGATGTPTIAWSSSDNAKATVNASGLVTGVATGSVGIRATATLGTSTGQGVATVNVVPTTGCVINGVTVAPQNASIVVGQTLALAPTVDGTNCVAADLGVTYTSGNTAIATVSASGVVTGVAGGTTTIVVKSVKDVNKQTAMAVEVTVPVPSTLSIQSVTQGGLGTPVNLSNVGGQIEVSLNVDRGDKTLDRVDVLIGGQVVASQTFTQSAVAAASSPETSAPVVVVQSVNTRQVAKVGTLFVPVIFNGQSFITANLYVVGTATPIASNAVPVLMNNSDGAIAPGALTDAVTGTQLGHPEPFFDGTNNWFAGDLNSTINYIAFGGQTPVAAPSVLDVDPACGGATPTWSGTATTGLTVTNTWGCAGFEGSLNITGPGTTDYTGLVGIDGSTLRGPDVGMPAVPTPIVAPGYSTVGAKFTLPGNLDRWNLVTPTPNALPGPYFVDNAAPVPSVGNVAFNDAFDQPWINATYEFAQDVGATDGGTGVALVAAHDYNDGSFIPASDGCTSAVVTTGDDYAETQVSSGTPDGERICAYAEDNLGNAASTGPSNYFGIDKVAPLARLAGAETPGGVTPLAPTNTVSATANTSIFGNAALNSPWPAFPAGDQWGLEALDERSGFDQAGAVAGMPAFQSLTRLAVGGPTSCPLFTNLLGVILSDTYVRTTDLVALDCGQGIGYYNYTGYVVDRAGNQSAVETRNFARDDVAAPTLASIGASAAFFTPTQPANFFLFGSDDLEVVSADLGVNYPGIAAYTGILYPQAAVGTRWDNVLTNVLAATPVQVQFWLSRVDQTCSAAAAPYASCAIVDGLPATATEYNNVGGNTDDEKNATQVSATALDVADQDPAVAPVTTGLLTAQTTPDDAEPWSAMPDPTIAVPGAQPITWRISATGATITAQHRVSTSVVTPFFDRVLLAREYGTQLRVCSQFATPARTDNGFNRFYTYSISAPTGTAQCTQAGGGAWVAIGLKNGSALITQAVP